MIRLTDAICLALVTLGLIFGSQVTQAQIVPQSNSVIDHYQNLYHGQSAGSGLVSPAAPLEITPSPSICCPAASNFAPQVFASPEFASPEFASPEFVSPELASPEFVSEPIFNNFVSPEPIYHQPNVQQPAYNDILDTRNYSLLDYRRLFQTGRTPQAHEMVGYWRGVNKGIVELVGYRQFIKEIIPDQNGVIRGDNIKVGQINQDMLRCLGWQPTIDPQTGEIARQGKFAIQPPRGIGAFKNGATFNYRDGGNRKTDPANLLVDKVVMLDANHMLGRATANFGPVQIPLAYFVLERIQ